jgi:PKHD-type hydroxylase
MNCHIVRLLTHEEAGRVVLHLEQGTFVDGKLTAQGMARDVKNNLQLDHNESSSEVERLVATALTRNEEFNSFTLPKRINGPLFNRYEPGMAYGPHVDNALMSGVRTDLSVTLFLSPPDTYDGGELVIHQALGAEEVKLDAGEAIIYPSTAVHHVAPVTRGMRLAAVSWVQSAVRDERLRTILFDLGRFAREYGGPEDAGATLLLTRSYHNLLRYAAEL